MHDKLLQKDEMTKIVAEKIKNNQPIKLHVGCGTNYFDSWINVDNNSDNNIEKLDVNWNLLDSLPIADNSVDFIYNEHFLEHLTVEEGQKVIRDFMRILKPGGVLRIAMPDLEETVNKYINVRIEDDPVLEKFGLGFIKTRAERINVGFRSWGHKYLYDGEELERRLKEAGCVTVTRCKLRESEYSDLQNLETRDESTLIMEVLK